MNYIERQITQQRRKKLIKKGAFVLLFLVLLGFAILGIFSLFDPIAGADVSVIRIEGTIITGEAHSGGYIGSEYVGARIRKAADDPLTRAIVLRIDSGGGTPAAAQEIIRDILYAKMKKPVVVSMGDTATSGAYYVAAYADRIYSSYDTMTGGLGVIWIFYDTSDQLEKDGLAIDVVKSGEMKDMTYSYRGLTSEEEGMAQDLVDASFNRFYTDISTQRNVSRELIEDARLIRGEQALLIGLVDEIGNLQDAIDGAREMARLR